MTIAPLVSSKKIGLWGSRSSGKTTFLGVLYHEVKAHGWKLTADHDLAAQKFISEITTAIYDRGQFPTATDPRKAPPAYKFALVPQAAEGLVGAIRTSFDTRKIYRLELLDAGGEAFENPDEYSDPDPNMNVYARLAACDGIIFLIDPLRKKPEPDSGERTYFQIVLRAFFELQQRVKVGADMKMDKLMAFCLTKMDDDAHYPCCSEPREHAKRVLGKFAMDEIMTQCKPSKYQFFATSAIGRANDTAGRTRSNTTCRPDGVAMGIFKTGENEMHPFGIADPVLWLIKMLN